MLAFLPAVLWLLFYLREDCHPEPKRLILLVFIGGAVSAIMAMGAELIFIGRGGVLSSAITLDTQPFLFFIIISIVEEYAKYLPIKFLILRRLDFDEPVDAMIYMMTAALGFAALENVLFIFPLFHESVAQGLEVTANRFLGANLLHALSSGIVGFFLARAFFHPRRHHFIAFGIAIAALLHTVFNYLILSKESLPQSTFYIIFLLSTMAVMVFIDFERLKRNERQGVIRPSL